MAQIGGSATLSGKMNINIARWVFAGDCVKPIKKCLEGRGDLVLLFHIHCNCNFF